MYKQCGKSAAKTGQFTKLSSWATNTPNYNIERASNTKVGEFTLFLLTRQIQLSPIQCCAHPFYASYTDLPGLPALLPGQIHRGWLVYISYYRETIFWLKLPQKKIQVGIVFETLANTKCWCQSSRYTKVFFPLNILFHKEKSNFV